MSMNQHPFYKPLWRRVAIVAVTGGCAILEAIFTQQWMWVAGWAALCAYSAWNLLIKFPKEPAE